MVFIKDESCKKRMKIGDKVKANCFPYNTRRRLEVKGTIIQWDAWAKYFVFEAREGQKHVSPLHECHGLFDCNKGVLRIRSKLYQIKRNLIVFWRRRYERNEDWR